MRMASKIDILTSGYATLTTSATQFDSKRSTTTSAETTKNSFKFMRATGSCCLVRSNQMNVLFDTMGPWEKDLLLSKLEALKLHPDDIEYLVCSHSHPDHIGNLNLFTRAKKHFVGTSVYSNDLYDLNCFEPIGSYRYKPPSKGDEIEVIKHQNYQLDNNLYLEPTPGHTMECISMIVNNCDKMGTVALAGDLFENEADITDEGIWLAAGSQSSDLQRASRSRIYQRADYLLPGHGPLFKCHEPREF